MAQRLSTQQIAQGLRQAGFAEDVIPTMTAVTMAESGGNPYAHNPNRDTGDNSYGLLQINMIDGMGPERRAEFGLQSDDQLFDPQANFNAAKKIYDTQGIGAWGAYTNGSYKQHMGVESAGGGTVSAPISGGSGALDNSFGGGGNSQPQSLAQNMATASIEAGMFGGGPRLAGALGANVFQTATAQPTQRMAGQGAPKISAPADGTSSSFVTGNTGSSTGPHLDFRVWDKETGGYVNNPGDYSHLVKTANGTSVSDAFQVTSPYGMREHPTRGGQKLHEGIDFATPEGTSLQVAGNFVESKWDEGGGGNMSIYDIGGGKEAVLMHGA